MGDLKRRLKGRLKGGGLRGGLRWRTFGLRWGTLRGGSKKSLRDGLKGGLRGDLPPQNPFPLASPASNFFSLYRPRASLTAKPAPATYTKTCPAYATPFVPTLPKTPSLKAPPILLPCFKFLLPLHCPLSGGLGGLGQVFVYVAPGLASLERLRRPPEPSLLKILSPFAQPLSEGLGLVFVYAYPP